VIIGPAKYTVKLQEILVMNIRHRLRCSLNMGTTLVQPLTAAECATWLMGTGIIPSLLDEGNL
jgi:hypothetical protein